VAVFLPVVIAVLLQVKAVDDEAENIDVYVMQ
jgi:hypothetical protein